ncbi:glutamate/tyrosine decarboxylase-like PLP-dependent enzyme [Streptomyces sp. B1I3]|nr:glutamate/tyrosine decarboxylase-like PLP-dependent enzyme [Streptomyces sp. B1I3]
MDEAPDGPGDDGEPGGGGDAAGGDVAHAGAYAFGDGVTVGLAIAREWLGEQQGISPAEHGAGALGTLRVLSGAAHSSVPKGLSMLGLGRQALVRVPTRPGREAVDLAALEHALAEGEGDGPVIVVANAGTVNTVDFDDLRAIAVLRERYSFWLHVDAAFGAFAALSPEHAHLVDGLDLADSICIDLHKWLNVPYDSAVQFTRRPDLQTSVFQNAAAYLGPLGDTPDMAHLTPENSRRLRALAAWFTLRAYGRDGHREITERCIDCARALGDAVENAPGLRRWADIAAAQSFTSCPMQHALIGHRQRAGPRGCVGDIGRQEPGNGAGDLRGLPGPAHGDMGRQPWRGARGRRGSPSR